MIILWQRSWSKGALFVAAVLIAAAVAAGLLFGAAAAGTVVAILVVVFFALSAPARIDELGGPDALKKKRE